ncbi:phycobilisome protein [Roseofilum reptotaenium CS-1145]|uniref:Phycobilisome protein n=1 Tax=Roseofilum reptotaenium AO1-A TaxID=1925591 RepID=A0A1L9QS15_9CYAN|nr:MULTISPECIES: phycobilisome protein [Roseofilum]MBP0030656.1 phycobilisome protein [Roseofilum sp. Guam]MDB9518316.1 phycobilisome protein [Roseofilum reptotaenium CS-1145]OJJ25485.1 phycobilisome protein [Roseofilum reptotaenium AO1-A]
MLSPAVQELITKAQIVSFESWISAEKPDVIQVFEQANQERQYLTDDQLKYLASQAGEKGEWLDIAKELRDRAPEIIDRARSEVLEQFPQITEPGGALYPEKRAENCWRDFWHFLRCIHYGIAGQSPQYTNPEGLHYMDLLYQELAVPLDAMVMGLESMKQIGIEQCGGDKKTELLPYFDHLIDRLKGFDGYRK